MKPCVGLPCIHHGVASVLKVPANDSQHVFPLEPLRLGATPYTQCRQPSTNQFGGEFPVLVALLGVFLVL